MEIHDDVPDTPPRDASTVVMLRDAPAGLEVFLLKRHGLSDVHGGAYVFPGGKVDSGDAAAAMTARMDLAGQALHATLGEPGLDEATAAGLYVAALREVFEETGVLYAPGIDAAGAGRATALLREGRAFDDVLEAMGLGLAVSQLAPWSRWVTPRVGGTARKRFDTRFFLAAMPAGQQARHDNHEATESAWLTPRQALEQYRDGLIELAPPQIMSLGHLSRLGSVAAAVGQARQRTPPVIRPEAFEQDGMRVLCYPGDERHSVRERALPGPTRLRYRNQRFEPVDGFDSLFG